VLEFLTLNGAEIDTFVFVFFKGTIQRYVILFFLFVFLELETFGMLNTQARLQGAVRPSGDSLSFLFFQFPDDLVVLSSQSVGKQFNH